MPSNNRGRVRSGLKLALLAATSSGAVTTAHAETVATEASGVSEIVILGSRRPEQTALTSSAPVDVIDTSKLQSTGLVELKDVLQSVAPSFNYPKVSGSDATAAYRPATLRGLSPDETLILVDGKRWRRTAFVNIKSTIGRGSNPADLSTIPLIALERIDVLRDGASAQYGSDAIAGAINLTLRGGGRGGEITALAGERKEGDGFTDDISGTIGFALPRDGFIRFSGEHLNRNATNRAGPDLRAFYFPGDPREATVNRYDNRQGDPALVQNSVLVNAEQPLDDKTTLYAFGNFNDQTVHSQGNFRLPNDPNNIRSVYPNGFLPGFPISGQDYSFQGGVRHDSDVLGKLDLSAGWGVNTIDFDVFNSLNASLGPSSKHEFYAGGLKNREDYVSLDSTRKFEVGLASPLTVAGGLGFRSEKYTVIAGEPDSYRNGGVRVLDAPNAGQATSPGSQGFPGFQPSDAGSLGRYSWSAYLDLEADLTKQFSIGLAGRFEDYSDFGSKLTEKLSARYAVSDAIALRATASTGFRAPSLAQQRYATTETTFVTTNGQRLAADIKQLPVETAAAQALGSKPLKPETSVNYSAGVVLTPLAGFDLSLDYYRITIDDRIVLSENLLGTAVQNILLANGYGAAAGARYFTNGVDTRTTGVDLVAHYRRELGAYGSLDLSLGANWGQTRVLRKAATPAQLAAAGVTLIGRQSVGLIERASPANKLTLGASYNWGRWTVSPKAVRYGHFVYVDNSSAVNDQVFGPQWVADIDIAYKVRSNVSLAIGADNLFDSYPDKASATISTNGLFPYSGLSPGGYNGAFYYARTRISF